MRDRFTLGIIKLLPEIDPEFHILLVTSFVVLDVVIRRSQMSPVLLEDLRTKPP